MRKRFAAKSVLLILFIALFLVTARQCVSSQEPPGPTVRLSAPENLAVVPWGRAVTLEWLTFGSGYRYRVKLGEAETTSSDWLTAGSWHFRPSVLGRYEWQVQAQAAQGAEGPWSEPRFFIVKPAPPSGLSLQEISTLSIRLTWTPAPTSGDSVDGYRIYRNGKRIGNATGVTPSFVDASLECGAYYEYRVRSLIGDHESDDSFPVNHASPDCPPPDLVVDQILFTPANPIAGQPVTITVRLADIGPGAAQTDFWLDIFIDRRPPACDISNSIASWRVAVPFPAGSSKEFSTRTSSLMTGPHQIIAIADSACQVSEWNEENNTVSTGITVGAARK